MLLESLRVWSSRTRSALAGAIRSGWRRRPSPALVVSSIALVVALGGTSYAAFRPPSNSVGTKQLKNGAVTTRKIRNGAVTAAKINATGLTVPSATQAADSSLLGEHAAPYFLSATGTAADSSLLSGHAASYFLPATATAADSSLLGGHAAPYFLSATGTAADSSLL